jgi:hypothetical protein
VLLVDQSIVDRDNVHLGVTVSFRGISLLAAGLVWVSCLAAFAQTPAPDSSSTASTFTLPSALVVGITRLQGSGIDIDKVPANVQ